MWALSNGKANLKASRDGVVFLYHKSFRTPTHGSNGANVGGKPREKEVCICMCR